MKKIGLLIAFLILCTQLSWSQVVISQVYGGGGNSGATYKNDFIEIFNRGNSDVNLTGWSVQYASATGSTWQRTLLGSFILKPGQYYLIQEAQGSGGTVDLPTPDATGSIAMSGTNGKVALVSDTTFLAGSCPTDVNIKDFIGFGLANCFEGAAAAPVLSNTTVAIRNSDGCSDTDDNSTDFITAAPNPRNTSSPFNFCTGQEPTLTVNPNSLTGFTYVEGAGPSTSLSYTLNGSNLTPADSVITVAGSTNFEVSSDDVNFSDTLKIDYTGGALADTTIYVRLKADLAVETYGETISNSGGGADEQLVNVSGSVTPLVALHVTPSSLSNFYYLVGKGPSTAKSYKLSGLNLTPSDSTIVIASPTNYEVSTDNSNFTDTLKIDYTGGSLPDTTIYVRLREGLEIGIYNGENIVNSGGGAQDINVTLNGYVTFLTPIDSLKMNDASGVTKMLNDTVNTTGIVTSIFQLGTSIPGSGPGTIQNANTAVSVYGNSFTQTPDIQIGDSVIIYNWKVASYNGLTELSYTSSSSVEIISSGHNIEPLVVKISDIKNQAWDGFEKYEAMFLQIDNVHFVQTGTFDVGTSSGTNYQIFDETDTLDLRIVKTNSSIIGKAIPTGAINVIGILQQFKSSAPYNAGYQIMPLDSSGLVLVTDVKEKNNNSVNTYQLYQNYPNPFNPSTKISFSLPIAGNVKLTIYNILGQEVQTLLNGEMAAGIHTVDFSAQNLSSGIYIYKLEAGTFVQTKKMTVLK